MWLSLQRWPFFWSKVHLIETVVQNRGQLLEMSFYCRFRGNNSHTLKKTKRKNYKKENIKLDQSGIEGTISIGNYVVMFYLLRYSIWTKLMTGGVMRYIFFSKFYGKTYHGHLTWIYLEVSTLVFNAPWLILI